MSVITLIFVGAVFGLAGLVKGVIGLGLPTVSMGLLALAMPTVEAAAILLLPSFLTNIWQMLDGPSLGRVARRLWPMLLAMCLGTWAGLGSMSSGPGVRWGGAMLGVALFLYAIVGLSAFKPTVRADREPVLGPVVGFVTGLLSSATGVLVIPIVPYLQAIGLGRDDLVQALGLTFTVSTAALAVNIAAAGAIGTSLAVPALVAVTLAFAGMWAGQALRRTFSEHLFRQVFFVSLLVLGLYLALRAAV